MILPLLICVASRVLGSGHRGTIMPTEWGIAEACLVRRSTTYSSRESLSPKPLPGTNCVYAREFSSGDHASAPALVIASGTPPSMLTIYRLRYFFARWNPANATFFPSGEIWG